MCFNYLVHFLSFITTITINLVANSCCSMVSSYKAGETVLKLNFNPRKDLNNWWTTCETYLTYPPRGQTINPTVYTSRKLTKFMKI